LGEGVSTDGAGVFAAGEGWVLIGAEDTGGVAAG
jgi:hypothetical protein